MLSDEELRKKFNNRYNKAVNSGATYPDAFLLALRAVACAVRADQIETDAEIVNSIAYIRDWDGYTVDDSAYQMQSDAIAAIRAQLEGDGA